MNISPVRSETDYDAALQRIDALLDAEPGTADADELDILATLVESYEARNHSVPPADPVEAIKFRMDQMGLEPKDLTPIIGSRSKVSEVLNRKRPLSLAMIRNLHEKLRLPLETLIRAA